MLDFGQKTFTFTELDGVVKALVAADSPRKVAERPRRAAAEAAAVQYAEEPDHVSLRPLLESLRLRPTGELSKVHSKVLQSIVEKAVMALALMAKKEAKLEGWRQSYAQDPRGTKRPPRPSRLQRKGKNDLSSFESQALHTNGAFVGRFLPRMPPSAERACPRAPPPARDAQPPRRSRALVQFVFGDGTYSRLATAPAKGTVRPMRNVQVVGSAAEIRWLLQQKGPGTHLEMVTGALQHACVVQYDPVMKQAYLVYRVEEQLAETLTEADLHGMSVGAVDPGGSVPLVAFNATTGAQLELGKDLAAQLSRFEAQAEFLDIKEQSAMARVERRREELTSLRRNYHLEARDDVWPTALKELRKAKTRLRRLQQRALRLPKARRRGFHAAARTSTLTLPLPRRFCTHAQKLTAYMKNLHCHWVRMLPAMPIRPSAVRLTPLIPVPRMRRSTSCSALWTHFSTRGCQDSAASCQASPEELSRPSRTTSSWCARTRSVLSCQASCAFPARSRARRASRPAAAL